MPRYQVTAPDGTKWEVNAPEGATQEQVIDYAKKQWSAAPTPVEAKPETRNNTLASSLGLTARAGLQALGSGVGLLSDPIGGAINALTPDTAPKMQTARSLASRAADAIGLPTPDTPMQRIATGGAEMMAGGAGMAGLAGLVSRAPRALPQSVAQTTASRLAEDPLMQVIASGTGGVAGQQAKEAGASTSGELISALGGTLLGAGGLGGARGLVDAVKNAIPQQRQANMTRINAVIDSALNRNSIDLASVDPAMRRALQDQVSKAMKQGPLNEDAIARLADYTRLRLTPTRARLTLDPYDVTQEQNASKVAAAIGARDARLPQIANDNNRGLLGAVESFGPVADTYATGSGAMAPIMAENARREAAKTGLYRAANDMAGGDVPLERGALNGVWDALEKGRKMRFLPAEVSATINDILSDQRAPFTVNTLDELKTTIATAQRSTSDGNVKAALKIVRDQLDAIPLTPDTRAFGGGQVVTEQGTQFLRQADSAPRGLMDALNQARAANASWRGWQESAPGIEAALGGANADTFIKSQIIGKSAGFDDVQRLAGVINSSTQGRDSVRAAIVQHLQDAAIGRGNSPATGNFSGRQWSAALSDIGERKLKLFFDPEEVAQLQSIGRVGAVETFQPRGSAVNNSSTAAGVAGLLQGLSKYLKPVANKLPLGQELISNPLDNITLSIMQRNASNVPRSLLMQQQNPRSAADSLLLPALMSGGLLAQ
jgi:hypothetical protein